MSNCQFCQNKATIRSQFFWDGGTSKRRKERLISADKRLSFACDCGEFSVPITIDVCEECLVTASLPLMNTKTMQ